MFVNLINMFKKGDYKKFSFFFAFTCILSAILIFLDFREYEKYKDLTHERSMLKNRVHPNPLVSEKENRIIFLLNKIELASSYKEVEEEFEEIEKLDPDNAYITIMKIKLLLDENIFKAYGNELKIFEKEKISQALKLLDHTASQKKYEDYRFNDMKHLNEGLSKNWPAVAAHSHQNHFFFDLGIMNSLFKIAAAKPDIDREVNIQHIKNIINLLNLQTDHQCFFFKTYLTSRLNQVLLPTLIEDFPEEFENDIRNMKNQIGADSLLNYTRENHLQSHFQDYFDSDYDRQAFDFKYGGRIQLLFFNKILDRFSLIILITLSLFSSFIFLRYWTTISEIKGFFSFPKIPALTKTFIKLLLISFTFSVLMSFILRDPGTKDNVCSLYDYIENQQSMLLLLKFIFLNSFLILPIIYISHKNRNKPERRKHWTMTLLFPIGYLTAALPALYFTVIFFKMKYNLIYTVLTIEAVILLILLLKFYLLFTIKEKRELLLKNVYQAVIYICIFCLSQQVLSSTLYRNLESYHFDNSLFYVPMADEGNCDMKLSVELVKMYHNFLENSQDECQGAYTHAIKRNQLKKMIIVDKFSSEED